MAERLNDYWFYLEPYTFIFEGEGEIVLYNTLNGAYIFCSSDTSVIHLIKELADSDGYCIKISCQDFQNVEIRKFIENVRNSFSGDCVPCNNSKGKPFVFKPILRLNDNSYKPHSGSKEMEGHNVLHYLNELSIYLTSSCNQKCPHCSTYNKQFLFCQNRNSSQYFPFEELTSLLNRMEKCKIGKVNFLGGNIFEYKYIQDFISILFKYTFKKCFFSHISNIDEQNILLIQNLLEKGCLFTILVTPELLDAEFNCCIKNDKVEYVLVVDSEIALSRAIHKIDTYPLLNLKIRPFFNGKNLDFFHENVFVNLEDILSLPINKKSIFRHQTLNENFFGKLTVMPDGETYANMNYDSLGNAFGDVLSINQLIYREMSNGKAWLRLRNDMPCKNCVNRYLCPSISNYELAIGKSNLCHIKK